MRKADIQIVVVLPDGADTSEINARVLAMIAEDFPDAEVLSSNVENSDYEG